MPEAQCDLRCLLTKADMRNVSCASLGSTGVNITAALKADLEERHGAGLADLVERIKSCESQDTAIGVVWIHLLTHLKNEGGKIYRMLYTRLGAGSWEPSLRFRSASCPCF